MTFLLPMDPRAWTTVICTGIHVIITYEITQSRDSFRIFNIITEWNGNGTWTRAEDEQCGAGAVQAVPAGSAEEHGGVQPKGAANVRGEIPVRRRPKCSASTAFAQSTVLLQVRMQVEEGKSRGGGGGGGRRRRHDRRNNDRGSAVLKDQQGNDHHQNRKLTFSIGPSRSPIPRDYD